MTFAQYPSLQNQVVLVTGGGGGIGACHVEQFCRQGATVGFIERDAQAAQHLLDQFKEQGISGAHWLHGDLQDIETIQALIASFIREHGDIDVLVNNAAHDERHELLDVSVAYWDERIALNLRHLFFCAQAVVPGMIRKGRGSIINLGSFSWRVGLGGMPVYLTAKAGIEGMTRGLARDLGEHGIRVNSLIPGWIMTPRQLELWVTPEVEKQMFQRQCLKKQVMPDDVARMALWLGSRDSQMCTAQAFVVDAGWS